MDQNNSKISFIPLGGIGDVTKNMYLYEYKDEILIVDCGLGFADETMIGVDLLLPDVSYLVQTKKKIVGMVITHGHEDHLGALPFVLPQLKPFPVYASPLTASLANAKLKDFELPSRVTPLSFDGGTITLGSFMLSLVRITHSVPDSANIVIKTPAGTFYHGSDFKFDDTPVNEAPSDYDGIKKAGEAGILCLMSDCLGAERKGHTPTESSIGPQIEEAMRTTKGKFLVTTYSSHIARLSQIIEISKKLNRKICFIGRSLHKNTQVAMDLGYLQMDVTTQIDLTQIKNYEDSQITFIVAGSQGQENSAMARIANGEHREIKLSDEDTVLFSSDPIPGNESLVYALVDTISRRGTRVIYSGNATALHVSGHGSVDELKQLILLVKPKKLIPIGGMYRHMVAYRSIATEMGYSKDDVFLLDDGQELIFDKEKISYGRKIPVRNVYVDEISGEEVETMVLRDRQKLSEGGMVVVLAEIDSTNGVVINKPDIIVRGFTGIDGKITQKIVTDITSAIKQKNGRVKNWVYTRKLIGELVERRIFKELRRRPLVLPVVIEV